MGTTKESGENEYRGRRQYCYSREWNVTHNWRNSVTSNSC